jgi:hypothetical protein
LQALVIIISEHLSIWSRHIIFGQAVILSSNKYCYSEGLSSNKAFIYVDSTHLCTNSTDLSDPSRDQANLASLL